MEIKSNFTTWFDRMCEYGFTENDYTVMWSDSKNGNAVEFEKMRITYWLLKKE
nr:antA/AntB antirepressor family protein [Clostridium sp. 1001271B_150615_H5]